MKSPVPMVLPMLGLGFAILATARATPPYGGTIFLDPDIITAADPTTYQNLVATGRGNRVMYDRRGEHYVSLNAYLFHATFDDGLSFEIQVNPEFSATAAAQAAAKYAPVIGRLPTCLRAHVQTIWIHMGVYPFGGGDNNLLIHTGQADAYATDGILEETLVHEASHTSLDDAHAASAGWLAAQTADHEFISTYARDNPTREDVAETFLVYLAVRYRAARITTAMANTISRTVPNRIAYFDGQTLDMYPIVPAKPLVVTGFSYNRTTGSMDLSWDSRPNIKYAVDVSTDLTHWQEFAGSITSQGYATRFVRTGMPAQVRAFFRVHELPTP